MKRQDVSGVERLAVDSTGGGGGSDVNLTGINGTTPSTNNGTSDAGTLRVTIASDSTGQVKIAAGSAVMGHVITDTGSTTAVTGNVTVVQSTASSLNATVVGTGTFAVQATLSAGSAVIGHVITDSGSTTAVTGNVTVVQGTGTNLHAVIDSGTITTVSTLTTITNAVTVAQATASSLNATVVGTGTFAVQAACTQTTSPWTVAGAAASGASKSGNPVQTGAVYNSTQPTVTTGQAVENQATARGGLIVSTGVDTFTVTANAGTNLNTSSLALDASVTALKYALTVTALQVTASGDTTLVSSGTRKLHRIEMSNSHATTALTAGIKIPSANGGAVFSKKYLPAAGGLAVLTFGGAGYLTVTSEAISVNLSTTGQVECTAYYE